MVTIAICDDEKYMRIQIKKLASDFFRDKNMEVEIIQFAGCEELLGYCKKIDILFLDIQMKGINGMEAAIELRKGNFKGFIIFITVLKEMVFQSFDVQAFDYLVKPIEETHFKKTMERLILSMKNGKENKLLVQRGFERNIISFDDIIFCEVIDRKIYLHLVSSDVIDFYDRIENLQTKLDDRFFRCHRSFLLNMKYLKSFKNGTAYMANGEEIPVSRLRSKEFSSVILQYMKEWRL